ncbi:hypothetical protein PFISCL1PPCAC_12514 [Pristionchus fissidentatus]|uniref:Receptor expression-enhancing protein n=1 Tax=Pristionchus fissidentatus TaxID=1538716 RepID=A0AAV5VND5_9BILA|nr:hypothetical protein PFISCL1PPCAC_12514 [Pristionchus fissidentatus]
MSELLSRVVVLLGGTLYPAYRSYKAVRTKDVREYVKWMMYWIVFALYQVVEAVADVFLSFWFPFYFHLKIVFVIWLLSPWTKGASILYRKWVHPALAKRERDIDLLLDQAKSESYNQMLRLGSQGMMCAKDIIATAAIRGQQQIVNQLQKSYSANDISQTGLDLPLRAHTNELEQVHEYEDDRSDQEFVDGGVPRSASRRSTATRSRSSSRTRSSTGSSSRPSGGSGAPGGMSGPYNDDEEYPATIPRRSTRPRH